MRNRQSCAAACDKGALGTGMLSGREKRESERCVDLYHEMELRFREVDSVSLLD